jgi:hypothetical protein
MFSKIALFFFIPFSLFAQIRDSVFIGTSNSSPDSTAIFYVEPLNEKIDSVFSYEVEHSQDSSEISLPDSLQTIQGSLDSSIIEQRIILYQKPFSSQSNFITKADILRNDYRYTGDLFKILPFSFERSYGFIGQPNDIYLYAEGSYTTSYFEDGVPVTSVLFNSLDFNSIQSEDIDSIELAPLPRGFLYGFANNPVSVNFISKDLVYSTPYSRIKYYEGPSGEAFIDAIFNMGLFSNLIASIDITNRKVDDSYQNSYFNIWQVKTKLRYNLLRDLNIIGSYYFSKSETGINGGVDVNAIEQSNQDVNSVLFNETLAPVYFENNSLNFKQHNFGLKIIAKPFEHAYTSLNFYYKFYLNEYYENDTSGSYKSAFKDKILGATLDQRISTGFLNLSLKTGYQALEHTPTSTPSWSFYYMNFNDTKPWDLKSFYASPVLSFNILDTLYVPSVYYKYASTHYKNNLSGEETTRELSGFGADLLIYFNERFDFYIGYSRFKSEYFENEKINTFEIKLDYIDKNGKIGGNIFNKSNHLTDLWGLGFHGSYQIWKILFEGNFSQYFVGKNSLSEFINIPETSFTVGLYYKDILFNSNLDLKSGFKFHYYGKQNLRSFQVPYLGIINADVESWQIVDFTMSAEIQKAAIVYFTWENLFDWNYYITPYFPMLERNIRFGIAWEIFN